MAGGVRSAATSSGSTVRTSRRARTRRISPSSCAPTSGSSRRTTGCDRLVMVWCGSTEVFLTESPAHQSIEAFEKALEASDRAIPSSMIYAYAAIKEGLPYANARAEPERRHPGAAWSSPQQTGSPIVRQGPQDRPDADQDDHRAGPQGAPARRRRLVLDQHPRQPRRRGAGRSGVVQDEGREQEVGARLHPPAAPLSRALQGSLPRRPHQLLSAARRQQRGLGQHRHLSAGSATRCS